MALLEEFEKQGTWLFRYRSFLPIVILLIGSALYIRTELYPETFFLEGSPYEIYFEYFCFLVSLSGLAVRIFTVGYTPRNTSGRNVEKQLAESLNTRGMYSIVRHPLYLGIYLMWLGPAIMTGQFWFIIAFTLFFWLYYERIMVAEEQFLRNKFGADYLVWAEKVPAFIPGFTNFRKPELPFSWKKVLKKEKDGLAALVIIFFLFNASGHLIDNNLSFDPVFMVLFIVSVVLYLILRFLKKKTSLLNEAGR